MAAALPKIRIDEVNRAAKEDARAFFTACNARYEADLADIAGRIAARAGQHRQFVLLSGPSASGKTTTSLKLKEALTERGVHSVAVSLDDFFREQDERTPDGEELDFESPQALDLPLFTQVAAQLLREGRSAYPVFDFKRGRRAERPRRLLFPQGSVAVVEGLHALNPLVAGCLPSERVFRLYVSVSSEFADADGRVLLTAQDVRLVRRMLRDYRFRASDAARTLELWDNVCKGEDTYVRPYKPLADATLDTVFPCEPCLFAGMALWHLESTSRDGPHAEKAAALIAALRRFERMHHRIIPPACVLREFLGGSLYLNKRTLSHRRPRPL